MRIGFIGTGTITQAVVTGMIRFGVSFERVALSPRNAKIAARAGRARLADRGLREQSGRARYVGRRVSRGRAADRGGRPGRTDRSMRGITSSASSRASRSIRSRLVRAPFGKVVRAVPLPAVAAGKGSTAICPRDDIARALFAPLGEAVEVDDEHQFDALSAATATMAAFFALLEEQASWLVAQGVPYASARSFLSGYHVGLAHEATERHGAVLRDDRAREHARRTQRAAQPRAHGAGHVHALCGGARQHHAPRARAWKTTNKRRLAPLGR